jgi:hypothetical protein
VGSLQCPCYHISHCPVGYELVHFALEMTYQALVFSSKASLPPLTICWMIWRIAVTTSAFWLLSMTFAGVNGVAFTWLQSKAAAIDRIAVLIPFMVACCLVVCLEVEAWCVVWKDAVVGDGAVLFSDGRYHTYIPFRSLPSSFLIVHTDPKKRSIQGTLPLRSIFKLGICSRASS